MKQSKPTHQNLSLWRGGKGFLAIEYVVLIAVVTATLIGMMVYLKRGFCGRIRTIGDSFGFGRQYPITQ